MPRDFSNFLAAARLPALKDVMARENTYRNTALDFAMGLGLLGCTKMEAACETTSAEMQSSDLRATINIMIRSMAHTGVECMCMCCSRSFSRKQFTWSVSSAVLRYIVRVRGTTPS